MAKLIIPITCALLALAGLGLASCASTSGQAGDETYRCPEGREIDTFCANLVRYARDPDTGHCCRYESQCSAPTGWKTFASKTDCEEAGDDD